MLHIFLVKNVIIFLVQSRDGQEKSWRKKLVKKNVFFTFVKKFRSKDSLKTLLFVKNLFKKDISICFTMFGRFNDFYAHICLQNVKNGKSNLNTHPWRNEVANS